MTISLSHTAQAVFSDFKTLEQKIKFCDSSHIFFIFSKLAHQKSMKLHRSTREARQKLWRGV